MPFEPIDRLSSYPGKFAVATAVFASVLWAAEILADELQDARENGVQVHRDISYLGESREEKMDLYLPSGDDPPRRPAVLIVHGGGWHGGDKAAKREQNIGHTLAGAGYVCASINYVLADRSDRPAARLKQVWPNNLHDCKTAIRYLRRHADRYRINPDQVGAIGGSAGGHLVAMLAATGPEDGLDPAGPYGDLSCRIQAVVPMYGVHDVLLQAQKAAGSAALTPAERELCRRASPLTYVTPDDPPALILHGTADELVPVKQSRLLLDEMTNSGVEQLNVIEGAPHSFHLQPEQQDLRPLVIDFLDRHLRR